PTRRSPGSPRTASPERTAIPGLGSRAASDPDDIVGGMKRHRLRPDSLWRNGRFMKLWAGQSISLLGTQVTLLAMPLVAILLLHATAFQVGALTAVEFTPFLLIGLPAGLWVDRLRRRPILIVA